MNTRTFTAALVTILIVVAVSMASGAALPSGALIFWRGADDSLNRIGDDHPLPVTPDVPYGDFKTISTATLTIGTSAAALVGTLPAGTRVLDVGVLGGALNYGNASVTTGALPFNIASGSVKSFPIEAGDTSPGIYLRGQDATCTVYLQAR